MSRNGVINGENDNGGQNREPGANPVERVPAGEQNPPRGIPVMLTEYCVQWKSLRRGDPLTLYVLAGLLRDNNQRNQWIIWSRFLESYCAVLGHLSFNQWHHLFLAPEDDSDRDKALIDSMVNNYMGDYREQLTAMYLAQRQQNGLDAAQSERRAHGMLVDILRKNFRNKFNSGTNRLIMAYIAVKLLACKLPGAIGREEIRRYIGGGFWQLRREFEHCFRDFDDFFPLKMEIPYQFRSLYPHSGGETRVIRRIANPERFDLAVVAPPDVIRPPRAQAVAVRMAAVANPVVRPVLALALPLVGPVAAEANAAPQLLGNPPLAPPALSVSSAPVPCQPIAAQVEIIPVNSATHREDNSNVPSAASPPTETVSSTDSQIPTSSATIESAPISHQAAPVQSVASVSTPPIDSANIMRHIEDLKSKIDLKKQDFAILESQQAPILRDIETLETERVQLMEAHSAALSREEAVSIMMRSFSGQGQPVLVLKAFLGIVRRRRENRITNEEIEYVLDSLQTHLSPEAQGEGEFSDDTVFQNLLERLSLEGGNAQPVTPPAPTSSAEATIPSIGEGSQGASSSIPERPSTEAMEQELSPTADDGNADVIERSNAEGSQPNEVANDDQLPPPERLPGSPKAKKPRLTD